MLEIGHEETDEGESRGGQELNLASDTYADAAPHPRCAI
jgi:hypothetical protein